MEAGGGHNLSQNNSFSFVSCFSVFQLSVWSSRKLCCFVLFQLPNEVAPLSTVLHGPEKQNVSDKGIWCQYIEAYSYSFLTFLRCKLHWTYYVHSRFSSFIFHCISTVKPLSLPAPTPTTCPNIKKHCVLWDKMHMSMIMAFMLQRTA